MSQRGLIDTNRIVRYLVQDNEGHARAAGKLLAACDRGEIKLVLLPAVLVECVFVLESFYKHPRNNVATALSGLGNSPGVELDDLAVHLDALDRYRRSQLHFVDCTIAATAAVQHWHTATFDQDFQKFPDVTVDID